MTITTEVYVTDCSPKGEWVFVAYPGGQVRIPRASRSRLRRIPQKYRTDVLKLARETMNKQAVLLRGAWSYDFRGSYEEKRIAPFVVQVYRRGEASPEDPCKGVLMGKFLLVIGWRFDPDGEMVVSEHDRIEVSIDKENTENLGSEDIPGDLVEEIIAAAELYLESWTPVA